MEHGLVARATAMGYQDRPYYRDQTPSRFGPLMWLLTGSVPVFTAFGIRVRAHATLLLFGLIVLVFGFGYPGFTPADRVQYVAILFLIVLLHEFGHCFVARWVGGSAEDILMHPLGGLAMSRPPRRPLPTFLTVAGGPAVNVLICIAAGSAYGGMVHHLPSWNPFRPSPIYRLGTWWDPVRYAYWTFYVSYQLLAFNLMPIYPLDGGQMTQAALWPRMGYYRSTLLSCVVGMVAAVVGGMVALATRNLGLAILAGLGFYACFNYRRQLLATGPDEYAEDEGAGLYAAAYEPATPRRRRKGRLATWAGRRAVAKARRASAEARLDEERLDAILAKVSANGVGSLTWQERRTLRKATEKRRRRDVELSR
jgi:stage IV sporulation protein FB